MDTCSNCGVTVRPGAKFCTACGTRLNDTNAGTSGSTGWGERVPVEETSATSGPGTSEASSSQNADVPTESSSRSSTPWTWGSSTTVDEPTDSSPATSSDTAGSRDSDTPAKSLSTSDTPASAGEFHWSWGSSSDTEPDETGTSEQSSSDAVLISGSDITTGPVEAQQPAGDSGQLTASEQTDDRSAQDQVMSASYDWQESGAYGTESRSGPYEETDFSGEQGDVQTTSHPDGVDSGSTDVQARAVELLDELRALIPALVQAPAKADAVAASASPGGSDDVDGVLNDLERARSEVISSGDLRSVLESARSRPRDMDVILDLVSRADSLIALLDDRDRLAAAIDRAVSGFRS